MDESTRNKIKSEILFGLPNHAYLQFVKSHFNPQDSNYAQNLPSDPFAPRISSKYISNLYISRESIEREINTPGSKIIQGENGIGKTALIQKWLQEPLSSNLTLYILTQLHTPVVADNLLTGEESLLSPKILIYQIFDSFWEYLICNEDHRTLHISKLRSNQKWMETLHWYYNHFTPIHATSHTDFELKAWLNEKPTELRFPENSAPEDILKELIYFITNQDDSSNNLFIQRIKILMDSTIHQNSPNAINRIIKDADHLHGLNIPNLEFTLFFNADSLLEKITTMTCISRGEIPYYPLPIWTKEELHELLSTRIMSRFPDGDKYDAKTHAERELIGKHILPKHLDIAARSYFTKTILDSFSKQSVYLPTHAVKLARIFCAAATGCWPIAAPYTLPLTVKQLEEIAELYWSVIQEGK